MEHDDCGGRSERFAAYVTHLGSALGHGRRLEPLKSYCTGLLSPCERKSVMPEACMRMLADGGADGAQGHRGAPSADAAFHRTGHVVRRGRHGARSCAHGAKNHRARRHFCVDYRWRAGTSERMGTIRPASGFPKKGKHSVGVARQY